MANQIRLLQKYNKNERKESTSATCTRVHFRPLKKGVVLHLAIVKKWVTYPLNI